MTYNFDPETWYENQLALLDHQRSKGILDEKNHERAVEKLDGEYDRMLTRLDGTYQLPTEKSEP